MISLRKLTLHFLAWQLRMLKQFLKRLIAKERTLTYLLGLWGGCHFHHQRSRHRIWRQVCWWKSWCLVLSLEFHGICGVVIVFSQDPVFYWDGKRNAPPTTQAQKMWFTSEHANGSMVAQWKILILNLTTSYIFIVGRHKNPTSGARICQSRACGFSEGLSITLDL